MITVKRKDSTGGSIISLYNRNRSCYRQLILISILLREFISARNSDRNYESCIHNRRNIYGYSRTMW